MEHDIALGVLQVLVQAHTRSALAKDARQRRLTHLNRLTPQARAVQLQQVEDVEERAGLVAPVAEQLKGSPAFLIATHHLAVDEAGPNLAMVHGLHDENNPAERWASRAWWLVWSKDDRGRNEKGRVRMPVVAHLAELEQQHRSGNENSRSSHPSIDG